MIIWTLRSGSETVILFCEYISYFVKQSTERKAFTSKSLDAANASSMATMSKQNEDTVSYVSHVFFDG